MKIDKIVELINENLIVFLVDSIIQKELLEFYNPFNQPYEFID